MRLHALPIFTALLWATQAFPASPINFAECETQALGSDADGDAARAWLEKCPDVFWRKTIEAKTEETRSKFVSVQTIGGKDLVYAKALFERFEKGDEHPIIMLKLGFRLNREARTLEYPDNITTVLARFNLEIQRRVAEGVIAADDAIFAAILFTKAKIDDHESFKTIPLSENLFVRPGIDEWPSPAAGYRLAYRLPQFMHRQWEEIVGGGFMPLSFEGTIWDHDLAHLTELYSPATMRELRRFYKKAMQQPESWRSIVQDSRDSYQSHWTKIGAYRSRLQVAAEAFSTVNLKYKATVRKWLPEFFGGDPPKDWKDQKARLLKLSPEALQKRIAERLEQFPPIFLRHGGSLRDPYNFQRHLNTNTLLKVIKEYLKPKSPRWPYPLSNYVSTPSEHAHRESLLGLLKELEYVHSIRWPAGGAKPPVEFWDRLEVLDDLAAEQLARLEVAVAYSVKKNMTQADLLQDSSGQTVSPKSKTSQFIRKWAREDGFLWEAFLSPGAQGKEGQ